MIYTLSWLSWYTHYHDYHGVFPPVRHGTYRAVQTTGILYVMSAVHRNTAAVLRVPSKSVFYTSLRPAFKPTPWILGTKICPKCFALYVGIHLKRLIFLPRDAHAYRGLCRGKMSVCLSVCLSVCHTLVFCLNNYTSPQSFFTIGYRIWSYQPNGHFQVVSR